MSAGKQVSPGGFTKSQSRINIPDVGWNLVPNLIPIMLFYSLVDCTGDQVLLVKNAKCNKVYCLTKMPEFSHGH